MPACGGLTPYPRRMGGGRPRLKTILDSLLAQRGSGYATETSTAVYLECMAFARALAAAWSTNARLANQADSKRMTTMLARWEKILALPVAADITDAARRERVDLQFTRIGRAASQTLMGERVENRIGDVFYAIEFISPTYALVNVNDTTLATAWASWGAEYLASVVWTSTVATIFVRLKKPAAFSDGEFYAAAGAISEILDGILPAWATWIWYRPSATYTNTSIAGGPSATGFFLDDDYNLDNELFDA